MALTAANVLVAEARVLYAAVGTTLPDETSVDYADYASWTSFTELGYTTTPTSFTYSYDEFGVDVQQSTVPIKRRKTAENLSISCTLAEFSGANLAFVMDGTNVTTAAGASQKGFDQITTGGDTNLPEWLFAFEGYRPDSAGTKQPVRIFVHKATVTVNGDIPFDKGGVTQLPITINALADGSKAVGAQLLEVHIVTAPATA